MAKKHYRKLRRLKNAGKKSDIVVKLKAMLYKTNVKIILAVILVVAVIVGIYLLNMYHTYDSYKVLASVETEIGEGSKYEAFGEFVVKYSENGVSYLDEEKTVWNDALEMKAPIIDVCSAYFAIADKNTNNIFVYNEEGRQIKLTTSYPIIKIEVAQQGVVAALLEDSQANYIEVFDKEGNLLVSHKALFEDKGYPLNFSLSEDGTKMIVSYLSMEGASLKNYVRFYNFSSAGKNSEDRMVGEFEQYGETIVPTVNFVTNDTAIAIGENVVSVYEMKDKPSLEETIEIEEEIEKVFYSEEYVGLVFENTNNKEKYRIDVYGLNGSKEMSTTTDMNFDTIKFSGENVLIYNDLNCKLVSFSGIEKFDYTFKGQIKGIIPVDGSKIFLLMSGTAIEKIQLN